MRADGSLMRRNLCARAGVCAALLQTFNTIISSVVTCPRRNSAGHADDGLRGQARAGGRGGHRLHAAARARRIRKADGRFPRHARGDPARLSLRLAAAELRSAARCGRTGGARHWYWMYSSFVAKRGIYLEDLYVRPSIAAEAWQGVACPPREDGGGGGRRPRRLGGARLEQAVDRFLRQPRCQAQFGLVRLPPAGEALAKLGGG